MAVSEASMGEMINVSGTLKGTDHVEDLGVDGKIILNVT
jgi:hypothetical protein